MELVWGCSSVRQEVRQTNKQKKKDGVLGNHYLPDESAKDR